MSRLGGAAAVAPLVADMSSEVIFPTIFYFLSEFTKVIIVLFIAKKKLLL
jgi:hypothetical protein